jgi:hypothetical protein
LLSWVGPRVRWDLPWWLAPFGLVGRGAMSARTGRNYGFDAAGNALTAGAMGLAGQYIAKSAIFSVLQHFAFRRLSH